jgi:hypothetical protein
MKTVIGLDLPSNLQELTDQRANLRFSEHWGDVSIRVDRIFAVLMAVQWLAGIAAALIISPRTWIGAASSTHLHVWAAILLGGAISALPIALVLIHPGRPLNRYVIAVAQGLWSALLIHLTGGHLETHFHVFASLAFLSLYRDWRVFVPATVVIAADHLLRGLFWPESVYGIADASAWRWLEHAGWVICEDIVLIVACVQSRREMRLQADQWAHLSITKDIVDAEVEAQTRELAECHQIP